MTTRPTPVLAMCAAVLATFAPAIVATMTTTTTTVHAALPTSGTGWALVENPDIDGAYVLTDAVESYQDWTMDANISSSADKGGLTPVTGSIFYYGARGGTSGNNTGVRKYFDDTLVVQAGTYTVTFSIGNMNDTTYSPPWTASLLADDGKGSIWGHTIPVSEGSGATLTKDTPTPAAGQWVTFTYTWIIGNDSAAIGKTLGFGIQDSSTNKAYAFDNLTITYMPAASVPEPATLAALLGGLALAAACFTRLRHC